MNYFLKKAGKEVEESSEISMEEAEEPEEIPVYENSGTSLGAGIVVKSQQKKGTSSDQEVDSDDAEDFEDEEEDEKSKKFKVKKNDSPKSDTISDADDDFEGNNVKKTPQTMYEQEKAAKPKLIAPV